MYWKVVTDNYHLVTIKTFILSGIWYICIKYVVKLKKDNKKRFLGDFLLNFLTKELIFSF